MSGLGVRSNPLSTMLEFVQRVLTTQADLPPMRSAGAMPAWTVPSERELDESMPTVAAERRRAERTRTPTRRVTHVVVVLPRDPRANAAARRLLAELKQLLPPGSIRIANAAPTRVGAHTAVLDLSAADGAPGIGRFRMPSPASEQWSLTSRALPGGGVHVDARSAGIWGTNRLVTQLLELTGIRHLSYNHTARPAAGSMLVPDAGASATGGTTERFSYRGMAPHTYHPLELSVALHDPSPRSMEILRRYVDWNVATGQNVIHFPLLDVEADNPVLKLGGRPVRRAAWEAHVRQLAAYARERGVQLAGNVSFTVFTAAHMQALGIIGATVDSVRLNRRQKAWMSMPEGSAARADAKRSYDSLLASVIQKHEQKIAPLVQRLAGLGFDEVHFNLGTSEFTSPNDDLQIAWINAAGRIGEQTGPAGVRVTVGSHVPADPVSPRYGIPMFDLHLQADAAVGAHIHTVQVPGLTDRAQTYGTDTFAHKLETLDAASKERLETWYPETSYWVQYDVTVPLFLPVYMLTRHRDHRRLLDNDRIDGQLTFTTAWEWGYWLNDAAMAKMTTSPQQSLTGILLDVLEPIGAARDEAVGLLNDVMRTQQRYLVDEALLRHLQGFDPLSTLGDTLGKIPGLNKFIHASSNVPHRTGWADIEEMDLAALEELTATDIRKLRELEQLQVKELARARRVLAAAQGAGPDAVAIAQELLDGIEINLLRTRQVTAALEAMVLARRSQLGGGGGALRDAMAGALQVVARVREEAQVVIRRREAAYRESPDDAYAGKRLSSGAQGTMWPDRSLTHVHDMRYWDATLREAQKAVKRGR